MAKADKNQQIIDTAERMLGSRARIVITDISAEIKGVHPAEVYRVLLEEGWKRVSPLTFGPPF